jgi:membrane protein implicated in regulation of membrane protease activity
MDERSQSPSPAELADEVGALTTGLGIITFQFFPLALPGIVLVVGPLAVLALAGLLLALPILVPLWLGRRVLHALRGRSEPGPLAAGPGHRPQRQDMATLAR